MHTQFDDIVGISLNIEKGSVSFHHWSECALFDETLSSFRLLFLIFDLTNVAKLSEEQPRYTIPNSTEFHIRQRRSHNGIAAY